MENKNYLEMIEENNLPKHIGIIMDGNGRWAKKRGMPRSFGHLNGAKRVVEIVRASSDLGIKCLTLFAFSTENWKRPQNEVSYIMDLLIDFIDTYIDELDENNVKLNILGYRINLSEKVIEKLNYAENKTNDNDGMLLNICFNYGGRQDILEATKKMILKYKNSSDEDISKITLDEFEEQLSTKNNSNVDLLIRGSGELRISNFLLYQIAYAEMYFSNVYWPDFDKNELYKAVYDFQQRNRRFGGL